MRVRIYCMRACSSSASRAMSSRLPSRVPAFSRASILASSRATSRFAPSAISASSSGESSSAAASVARPPSAAAVRPGSDSGAVAAAPPRLRQPLPRIGSLGGLGFAGLEGIPQLAAARVDGHSWVGPGPDEARLPIDAVEGDLFAHHHLSEQAASDPLVAGLGADVLEKGPGARLWGGRREKQRELTVRLG